MISKELRPKRSNLAVLFILLLLIISTNQSLFSKGIEANLTAIIRNENISIHDKFISSFFIKFLQIS